MTASRTLFEALEAHLREDVQGRLEGFAAYQNRIAINLLAILEREALYAGARRHLDRRLASSLGLDSDDLAVRLARGLRDGDLRLDDESLELLRQSAVLALAIDNPRYSGFRQARQRWPGVAAAVDAAVGADQNPGASRDP